MIPIRGSNCKILRILSGTLPRKNVNDQREGSRRTFQTRSNPRPLKSFADTFVALIEAARNTPRQLSVGECQSAPGDRCRLCHAVSLTYEDEVALRQRALAEFWSRELSGIPVDPLVPSPRGRAYRTVTKRRAFRSRGGVRIGLIDPSDSGRFAAFEVMRCAIEPDAHAHLFAVVREFINTPHAEPLAGRLLYVVIKGSTSEFGVIFHVREITHDLVQTVNILSKILTGKCKGIVGVFVMEGNPTGERTPRYYLGDRRARPQRSFRKIFGERDLTTQILGRRFAFSPLSFTQANQSLFAELLTAVRRLLHLRADRTFYDLYCGYGPFSLCYAGDVRSVIGIDASPEAIASAIANARKQRVVNARFLHSDITPTSLRSILKSASPQDTLLLDPPRNGTAPGVVEFIAARRFACVAHIFCSIDLLPSEVRRWRTHGYRAVRAVPFDMFPGTSEVEILVLLEPEQ